MKINMKYYIDMGILECYSEYIVNIYTITIDDSVLEIWNRRYKYSYNYNWKSVIGKVAI